MLLFIPRLVNFLNRNKGLIRARIFHNSLAKGDSVSRSCRLLARQWSFKPTKTKYPTLWGVIKRLYTSLSGIRTNILPSGEQENEMLA